MNQALSIRPTQAGRALVLLAALGFTALVGLAALEPTSEPNRPALSVDASQSLERDPALRTVEPGALPGASSPRFERSSDSEIFMDPANPHGG